MWTPTLVLIAITTLAACISLGGGLYEFLVIDPYWPKRPGIIQPRNGGVSRARFWIPAHTVFEVLLVLTLVVAWGDADVRIALVVGPVSHAMMRVWSLADFVGERTLHALGPSPLSRQHEKESTIRSAQHGGEDRPVVFDPLQHSAAFFDAYASTFGRVGAACVRAGVGGLGPDRALGVEADPVGSHVVGPHPTVREAAVGVDVERGQPSGEGLRNDECGVVRRDHHPVRKVDLGGDATSPSVGSYQRDDPGFGRRTAEEIESEAIDVDVAATVDHDLVPVVVRHGAEVGMHDHRPVRLLPQQLETGDKKPAVRQPVNRPTQTGRAVRDNLTAAIESRSTATTSPVPQWANQSRSSCHRGDST